MKNAFPDPIKANKKPKPPNHYHFIDMEYDDRSGPAVDAGTNYGTGFNVPVGSKEGKPGGIPRGAKTIIKT